MVPHPPLIIPEVGGKDREQIRETINAYEKVADEVAALKPETIIISSPHTVMYADYFHISPGRSAWGSFERFGAPETEFNETYDTELVSLIGKLAEKNDVPAGTLGEKNRDLDHGTMVPLWFIRQKYNDFRIVRIGLSGLPLTDHYRLGMLIAEAVKMTGRNAVYIASGDLSHKLQAYGPYGFAEEGPQYDERIMDVCGRAAFGELFDFDETFCDKAAECGHRSFVMMAGAFDGVKVRSTKLSHQDVTGVGYGICTFYPEGEDESRHFLDAYMKDEKNRLAGVKEGEDPYVQLARRSLQSYIRTHKYIDIPDDIPAEMKTKKAGVFVSLHEFGRLRGCIGTTGPVTSCIAEEIICNAVSAAARDPRFDPVRPDELDFLEINVDVLGDPEPIETIEGHDVRKYGIIVTDGYRKGLLLPDLEGVDTPEEQLSIALRKAGIDEFEHFSMERFEVVRHR